MAVLWGVPATIHPTGLEIVSLLWVLLIITNARIDVLRIRDLMLITIYTISILVNLALVDKIIKTKAPDNISKPHLKKSSAQFKTFVCKSFSNMFKVLMVSGFHGNI